MNIYGERVVLRALEESDNTALLELINDPETELMLGGRSLPTSMDTQENWYRSLKPDSGTIRCAITDKQDKKTCLGTVILSDLDRVNGTAQIHIKLLKSGRRKGFGSDAVNAMVLYAFQQQRINCVYAEVLSYNKSSQHMFEKCGFVKEGILRERVFKSGSYVDVLSYSILRGTSKDEK